MSAKLDALEAEARAVDLAVAPAPVADEKAQAATAPANEVAELAALITILSSMFVPVFPSLANIYTPETISSLASAAVPVMQKRGWSTSELLGKYAEELALAAVAAPVALATWQCVKADSEAAKRKNGETAPAAVAAETPSKVVSFGTVKADNDAAA